MLVEVQLVGVPFMPAKETVLVPCEAPKLVPVMVTDAPTGPVVGERLLMLGGGGFRLVSEKLAGLATPVTEAVTV
jgi:hypothetical protein